MAVRAAGRARSTPVKRPVRTAAARAAQQSDLDLENIAAAAMRVADERGAAGFTMRAVAEELGVTAMALYHHVPDKAGLVALIVDASIAEHPLPPPTGVWREDLWELALWTRRSVLDHPAVGKLRQAYRVWTPSIFPMTERWLSVWQQSGLPLDAAVTAAVTSSLAVTGMVEQELVFREMDWPVDDKHLAMLPNARLLFSAQRDSAADFELLVRALIDGLYAQLGGLR
jgi:AcrR family transcriptional regulator